MSPSSQVIKEQKPLRIFVLDSTRLRSHVFFRYFSNSVHLTPLYHPFMKAGMMGRRDNIWQHLRLSETRQKEVEEVWIPNGDGDTIETLSQKLEQKISEAEKEGFAPFINEHWWCALKPAQTVALLRGSIDTPEQLPDNPTHFPDKLFQTLKPIVLIRHPVLWVDSIQRTAQEYTAQRPGDEDFGMVCSGKEMRVMFDFFQSQGREPIVVDGEDMVWRTEEVKKGVCAALGLDESGLTDEWEPAPKEETDRINPMIYQFTWTIHGSRGIERPSTKPEEPSLEKYTQKWTEKYGKEDAAKLRQYVEDNIPHYEYLSKFKI